LQSVGARLDRALLARDALEQHAILLGNHYQEVPARKQLRERLGREQELQLATGRVLVEAAQPVRELRLLLIEAHGAAVEVRARDQELAVERAALALQRAQPLARRGQLLLGAAQPDQLVLFAPAQPRGGLAVLARLLLDLLQLGALRGLEAVLR